MWLVNRVRNVYAWVAYYLRDQSKYYMVCPGLVQYM